MDSNSITRNSNRGSTGALSSSVDSITGTMHHSLSTPAGVDGGGGSRTPPATPKKGGKMLAVRVQMLDDTVTIFQVQAKAMGRVLFEQVCKQLHLLEADYFGLEYADPHGTKYWLDLQKPISRQLGLSLVDPLLYFCVKFYTPDPAQLEEEYTRYLFCLQIKRDLAQGILQCNENTAAVMASYIVQAECGDFVPEDYPDHTYLSSYKFVPQQDHEMEKKIMENHKKHSGQSPAEADLNLLETARRCELYGMKMHPAKDHENVPLNLACAHMGIVVFQNFTKINTFSWAKIRKISFKRKRFLIKLHPEGYGYYKDCVEFIFEGRNECKNFWKKCVENHGFFRCPSVKHVSRHKTRVLSRGSSFRYSGKTQKEIVEFVRDNYVKRQTFQRSHSFRHSSAHSSHSNMHTSTVGNSISAHPLLPLADSSLSVEASKLSASLGSMGGAEEGGRRQGSPTTTRSASRRPGTATSWSSVPDTTSISTRAIVTIPRPPAVVPMMSSPSPTETRSASEATSATASPLHTPPKDHLINHTTTAAYIANRGVHPPLPPPRTTSPLAVRAAVHRADIDTTRIHTIIKMAVPSSHKSEGSLDYSHHPPPAAANFATNGFCPSQTQSHSHLDDTVMDYEDYEVQNVISYHQPKRKLWQRSASCKDLYDYSFEETGKAKRRLDPPKPLEKAVISLDEQRSKLDSPVTVYDDHRALYSASSRDSSLEIEQDIIVHNQQVYVTSYPGPNTLFAQESFEDPGNYDLKDSNEDVSHDSYELIEKSDEDYSTSGDYKSKKPKPLTTRSCSLDSGNYLPSDSESEGHNIRHKSVSDHDIFQMEDPRDFPREIIPRRSDGSFYKSLKQGSRTSSLESKSDYYESKSKSSKESLKRRGVGSRTSSQESKSEYENKRKPLKKNKSADNLEHTCARHYYDSRTSSQESKSEYFDAPSKVETYAKDFDRKITFERNYGTHIGRHAEVHNYPEYIPIKETSHVHSISLQNVETEQSLRVSRTLAEIEQNTLPRAQKTHYKEYETPKSTTHIWPEAIKGLPTEVESASANKSGQRSTESESNIFSFDEDRIQSLQESSDFSDHGFGVVPNIDQVKPVEPKKSYRDVFMEIEPRICHDLPMHQPIERTKSDPNSIARQKLNFNARRLLLMHQKSIDLTPAESSDEDYLYKQIPSAPPITKFKGTHFELPTAEFGHFDILKREIEGQKTKFEVPKSQFEVLGAKTQSDFINLPPKEDDISYVLHKRHILNGVAQKEEVKKYEVIDVPKKDIPEKLADKIRTKLMEPKTETSFLFTQNIDLSKVDPVTLEVDKSAQVQLITSPKRDITHIDPATLETLNSKLSQIESDSPTSSRTESIKPMQRILSAQTERPPKIDEKVIDKKVVPEKKLPEKIKSDKPKRIIRPRMQPGKKGIKSNKTKVRITSFSSDDESLDSDDVFGSAEATPTKIEFSPPQMRKEMESILKFESERKYLQYTMSSTEVEGSPPTTRKKKDDKRNDNGLDPNIQTELRRISERSFSIPSSEDEFNIKTTDLQPVFADAPDMSKIVEEEGDKSMDETLKDDDITDRELVTIEEEREREKALLAAEIENDIKNLQVPPKTKITEIHTPGSRSKGQSPLLFAHARLNLSEGSAITLLQKQQALESPLPSRRARSLDAPVISVNKLPPLNAFSSKDDTVDEEDTQQTDRSTSGPEYHLISEKSTEAEDVSETSRDEPIYVNKPVPIVTVPEQKIKGVKTIAKDKENDQIVPDLSSTKVDLATGASKVKGKPPIRSPKTNKKLLPVIITKDEIAKKVSQKAKPKPPIAKPPIKPKASLPCDPKARATSHKLVTQKAVSAESRSASKEDINKDLPSQKSLPTQSSLALPEIKRTKSQEMEPTRRTSIPKEKAKSLEKLELKRTGSKERTKSQEDNEDNIAERRKLQQMLYETAIKQTKTLKSPVKDVLPVFPQVTEKVRERHGKLEISINTIEPTVSLEEAIIITKSPKKLDKRLDKKLTKSLELTLNDEEKSDSKYMLRQGKSLDLDSRKNDDEGDSEFDFQPHTIRSIAERDQLEETSPESYVVQETVTADIHIEPNQDDRIILEDASLDVWLSMKEQKEGRGFKNIEVIKEGGSGDFFEKGKCSKPPDLGKISTKSSSDSQSFQEKVSLGNSLDIKYIDESGDSSHKSEKDKELIEEMQKASNTVSKFLRKKLAQRRRDISEDSTLVPSSQPKLPGEDESLTEVSELNVETPEQEKNFLQVTVSDSKDTLLKLSIERSKSEDGSWVTVECEEYVGTESSFDYDNPDSPEKDGDIEKELESNEKDLNLLTTDIRHAKMNLIKRLSDQSKSSDTTGSWTSGEKEPSPGNQKDTDESSASCSMGVAIGLSQTIEMFASREQMMEKGSSSDDPPRSPRSPRSPRICVLGRAFTIDEGSQKESSSSDEANDIPKDLTPIEEVLKESSEPESDYLHPGPSKKPYPFEEKWSHDSEMGQLIHKKLSIKLSSAEKNSFSSVDESFSDRRRNNLDKPKLGLSEKLSTESRNSLDTESSSGSFGIAARMGKSGDIPKELSSTWKPFPLGSSDSESFDDGLLPPDQDLERQEYFLVRDNSGDFASMADIYYKPDDVTPTRDDTVLPEDLANFQANFHYPALTSLSNISIGSSPDVVVSGYSGSGPFLSRTLSRISERSTNSEKSSLEDDSTKASTQSDSLNDESVTSSNPQVSASSESPSHAHVYDDKKTPTNEIPKSISRDNGRPCSGSIQTSEKQSPIPGLSSLLQRQISDDRRTSAEMAELSMDEIEIITSERGLRLRRQGSDDTIIDEECFEEPVNFEKQSSQDSEDWPLPDIPNQKPLLAMHEVPSSDTSQLTTQVYQPPSKIIPKTFGLRRSLQSQESSEQWPSPPSSIVDPIVGNVETHYISPAEEAYIVNVDSTTTNTGSTYENDSNSEEYKGMDLEMERHTYENIDPCGGYISESLSESVSVGTSGVKIVVEKKSQDSNSDDDNSNLNDDVFVEASEGCSKHELRPPTALRRSTASDDSRRSSPAGSHSSYSEEDCTSSMGTNMEDGTVRYALKPTKCTHSSHSEDTSIALSLSEWSNSTNTVKFQNLSSASGTTKSSSGLKSDENSLTDIAQSLSEWSSSGSTLKAQHNFQKLSSTTSTTGDSTLTELIPNIADWPSESPQPYFAGSLPERAPTRLGSTKDVEELSLTSKSLTSESLSMLSTSLPDTSKYFTKSTERPIIIPVQIHSDTDSSIDTHKTVHTQRYDKEKQRYLQKYTSKSTDRPVKVSLKLSKCSPYYSSSLSSESTPLASTSPIPISKTATVPLTRIHRKPISRSLSHAKSPPSENDSTSSVESPKSKSEREKRGYRRKRQMQSQRRAAKLEKETHTLDEYYFVEHEHGLTEYSEYIRERNMEEIASTFQYEGVLAEDSPTLCYQENVEEGYFPDVDSGSDIFHMERDEGELTEGFDVSSIPPPLLEDDFEYDPDAQI